jgi:hypothetical protein
MMRRGRLLAVVLLELLAAWPAAAAAPAQIAVFDFELWDSSLEGEVQGAAPADEARLALIGRELRAALTASGRYRVVDTAPAAAEIARAGYWRSCNGCEVAIAERLGADLALVGWVQKVSNLILNINVTIREVPGGELVFAGGVDIRGNTDESWQHGIRYLLKNRLLKD